MTRHVTLKSSPEGRNSPPTTMKKQPERRKVGEVAGGAAAEFAAVCCCCPCAVVHLAVLAVYKAPAAVCKKALSRSKRRRFMRKRHGFLAPGDGEGSTVHARLKEEDPAADEFVVFDEYEENCDVIMLDNEMLDHFYGAGFWRSPSQRDNSI